MNEQGFIKLSRKYFDHFLWNEPRIFSKAEAWLDLIGTARFEATTEIINGHVIEIHRGELPASRRYLEQRWRWGGTKVSGFLRALTTQGMICQRQHHGQTIITLCKYDNYNNSQTTGKPVTNTNQLTYPYTSGKFISAWEQLAATSKWKKKSIPTLQLSLNQLAKFEEGFAIRLVELAAANNWQGVVFADTELKYRQWKAGMENNTHKSHFANHDNNNHYEKF